MKKIYHFVGLLAAAILLLLPQSVSASSLFEHAKTLVPAGQTVDDLYVVGGDADILGHATGAVVVVNGNLHLAASARVDGTIVVIGGRITQDEGALTGDDIHNISLDTVTQNSLLIGGGLVAGLWTVQLAGSLLLIVIPVLVHFIGWSKAAAWVKREPNTSWRKQLYLGALSGAILIGFSLLCVVTLIGIPLLLVVILFLFAAFVIGITSLSYEIGGLLQEKWTPNERVRLIIGASLITAFASIPLIGWLVMLFIIVYSLGTTTQWLYKLRRRKKR
ncbi:hypothetical protein GE107_24670 [Cohnella sp. CFH 77786]|uniref:hypothetical protein n=1 Tax=Cohnella sp. CFH 77786 TaxID=2662265 RepID=UPI001C60D9C5|nr:hypothetical protein [Cohnella sp. CFH 77786]MBW5449225.1 hypothetical protein [Cohnella sp. CFH 77786]